MEYIDWVKLEAKIKRLKKRREMLKINIQSMERSIDKINQKILKLLVK